MVSESRKRKRARERHRPAVRETSGPPCCLCRTTGGKIHIHSTRPARVSVEKFGIKGKACNSCYDRLRLAATPVAPCASCGDPAGESRRPGARPVRYDGTRFGVAGKVCGSCAKSGTRSLRAATGWPASGGGRPEATYLPPPAEVARGAAVVIEKLSRASRRAEERRRAEAWAASRWVTPEVAARMAVVDYRASFVGELVGWPLRGKKAGRAAAGTMGTAGGEGGAA